MRMGTRKASALNIPILNFLFVCLFVCYIAWTSCLGRRDVSYSGLVCEAGFCQESSCKCASMFLTVCHRKQMQSKPSAAFSICLWYSYSSLLIFRSQILHVGQQVLSANLLSEMLLSRARYCIIFLTCYSDCHNKYYNKLWL